MLTRRALVVGAQCTKSRALSFLPDLSSELAAVLADPELGGWTVNLVEDPTCAELDKLIEEAFRAADDDSSVLLLALIGHGRTFDSNYYFLPQDGTGEGRSRRDLRLTALLDELLRGCRYLQGLVLMIDTCESGVVANKADDWLHDPNFPYHIMTAAQDGVTASGNFTRALIDKIRVGDGPEPEYLTTHAAYNAICELKDVKARRPQHKANNDTSALWLARNPAYRPGEHPPRAAVWPTPGIGATGRRALDAYLLPTDSPDPRRALCISERDRVQLSVLWGLDRTPLLGVAVDLPDSDLAADLDAVEDTIAPAVAALELPRRRWVSLPIRHGLAPGAELRWSRPPPAPDRGRPLAFVLPIDVDQIPELSPSDWQRALLGVLPALRTTHPDSTIVVALCASSALAGVRAAGRVEAAIRAVLSPAAVDVDVATRFVPGAEEGCAQSPAHPPADDRRGDDELLDRICAARGWAAVELPAHPPAAELAAELAARLGAAGPPAGDELERVRLYAGRLWRPLLRCWALDLPSSRQPAILEIAARLDEDLETWLDARLDAGGPYPADLPEAGHPVPDALARIYRWRRRTLPDWLPRRLSRPDEDGNRATLAARDRPPLPAAGPGEVVLSDRELLTALRRRPLSPEGAREVVGRPLLRHAVGLVPLETKDAQLLLHIADLRAVARPPRSPAVLPTP